MKKDPSESGAISQLQLDPSTFTAHTVQPLTEVFLELVKDPSDERLF